MPPLQLTGQQNENHSDFVTLMSSINEFKNEGNAEEDTQFAIHCMITQKSADGKCRAAVQACFKGNVEGLRIGLIDFASNDGMFEEAILSAADYISAQKFGKIFIEAGDSIGLKLEKIEDPAEIERIVNYGKNQKDVN